MFGVGDLKHDIESLIQQDTLNRVALRQVPKSLLKYMPVGVFETDNEGEYVWVNRKYLRMTGRAPDEVKGSGWIDSVAPRDLARVVQDWNAAINEKRECVFDYTLITQKKEVQVTARTYKMANGFLGLLTPLDEKSQKR